MITYAIEQDLSVEEFKSVLERSTLGERRPINDLERLSKMVSNANITITARDNGLLVGVSRALSDFTFCTYLSDLAVDVSYQKSGIGKELIRRTKLEAPTRSLSYSLHRQHETIIQRSGCPSLNIVSCWTMSAS